MAHEHLLKAHIYLHTASGDTPVLEYRRLRSHISKRITSRFFQKWCSSGVVSAFLLRRTIDFTGFWGLSGYCRCRRTAAASCKPSSQLPRPGRVRRTAHPPPGWVHHTILFPVWGQPPRRLFFRQRRLMTATAAKAGTKRTPS